MRAAIAALLALILSVTAAHAQPVPAPGCPTIGCTYTPPPAVTSATISETTGAAGPALPIANPTGIVVGQIASGTNIPAKDTVQQISGGTAVVTGLTAPIGQPAGSYFLPVSNSTGLSNFMTVYDTTTTNALGNNTYIKDVFGNASAGATPTCGGSCTGAAGQTTVAVASGGLGCVPGMLFYDTTAAVIPTDTLVLASTATDIYLNNLITDGGVGASDTLQCYPALYLGVANQNAVVAGDALVFSPAVYLTNNTSGSVAQGATINFASNTATINNLGITTLGFVDVGAAGVQQYGQTILNTMGGANGSTFVGVGAGASAPPNSAGATALGWHALYSSGQGPGLDENTAVGYLALNQLQSTANIGQFNTAMGAGAIWNEIFTCCNTAIGGDVMRDTVGASFVAALGHRASQNGASLGSIAIGYEALQGNSSFIKVGGTKSTGDTISITFTGTFSGSPVTTTPYTVLAGDTLASITTALINAINAAGFLGSGSAAAAYNDTTGIYVAFPGTQTTGWAVTITSTIGGTGAQSETITPTGGNNGQGNIAIGYDAETGNEMSSAYWDVAIGQGSMPMLTTGYSNVGTGYYSLNAVNSGYQNTCEGTISCQALTTATNTVAVGWGAAHSITTASSATAIGAQAGYHATAEGIWIGAGAGLNQTSGAHNVALGASALEGASSSTSAENLALGDSSLASISSGTYNICLGYISCGSVTSGAGNVMIGAQTGYNSTTTGSGDLYIASGTTVYNPANASHQLFIGDGGAGSIVGTGINTSATETLTLYGLTDLPNLPSSSPGGTISGVCWSSTAGELWGDTSSTICGISAIKYKNLDPESEAVQPGPALAGLDTLRTDAWHYKPEFQDHGKDVHVGLIADDVAKMDPRCGAYDDKGELYNYQDRCVTAYVIAAVKGLEARSEAQQREIWALAAACLVLLLWCAGITGVLVRRG